MDNREFGDWLERHALSKVRAAAYLQQDITAVNRYASGALDIPGRVELACRALDPLDLFKLTPIDPTHNDWRASTNRKPVIVRAQDENLARWQASTEFYFAARKSGDEETPSDPWLNAARTKCERLKAAPDGWVVEGQPGVLHGAVRGTITLPVRQVDYARRRKAAPD